MLLSHRSHKLKAQRSSSQLLLPFGSTLLPQLTQGFLLQLKLAMLSRKCTSYKGRWKETRTDVILQTGCSTTWTHTELSLPPGTTRRSEQARRISTEGLRWTNGTAIGSAYMVQRPAESKQQDSQTLHTGFWTLTKKPLWDFKIQTSLLKDWLTYFQPQILHNITENVKCRTGKLPTFWWLYYSSYNWFYELSSCLYIF